MTADGARRFTVRAAASLAILVVVVLLLSLEAVFVPVRAVYDASAGLIDAHPLSGALLFVLLAAVSAMLAFFSSAVLIPGAVLSFGKPLTAFLLWLGWLVGGAVAYALGRYAGRPLVRDLRVTRQIDEWRAKLPPRGGFLVSVLVQLALPSEIPGYLFGMIRLPFAAYFGALALVQAPYALALAWAGDRVLQREPVALLAIGAVVLVVGGGALVLLGRRIDRSAR